jgi:F-type H+-transporting ATPase subunit c
MKEQSHPNDLRTIAHKTMADRGLEPDFPPDAIQQLSGIQEAARETGPAIRDLRSLLWCSAPMDSMTIIAIVSIICASAAVALGSIAPALGEGRAVSTALNALAQQPDAASSITRTLFVGLAMIESIAIYCLVISMILIFANPFWDHVITQATGR